MPIVIVFFIFIAAFIVIVAGTSKKSGKQNSFESKVNRFISKLDEDDDDDDDDFFVKPTPKKPMPPRASQSHSTVKPTSNQGENSVPDKKEVFVKSEPEPVIEEAVPVPSEIVEPNAPVEPVELNLYTFGDINQTEIMKYYTKKNQKLSFTDSIEEKIENANYKGTIYQANSGKYLVGDLELLNLDSDYYHDVSLSKDDVVKIGFIFDYENRLVDLSVSKIGSSSFTREEKGDFLFSFPDIKNIGLSFGQFSYFKASEIVKLLVNAFSEKK